MRLVFFIVLATACFEAPSYDGTMYKCDVDGICATGFACVAGICSPSNGSGNGMVSFEAATFTMGCSTEAGCAPDAMPPHAVMLSRFAIDKTEVTLLQFQRCIDDARCDDTIARVATDAGDAPVHGVSWANAQTYCGTASGRLPTEAEWERAARGQGSTPYPWGTEAPDCGRANGPGCGDAVAAVDSMPDGDSTDGIAMMAGNVREWVSDSYAADYYMMSPTRDPQGGGSGAKVTRGGSYLQDAKYLTVFARGQEDPVHGGDAYPDLGFRCARSL
jgi:formylglycine-generating enzyme